jgi:uncharacterized protein (DUF2164 family)
MSEFDRLIEHRQEWKLRLIDNVINQRFDAHTTIDLISTSLNQAYTDGLYDACSSVRSTFDSAPMPEKLSFGMVLVGLEYLHDLSKTLSLFDPVEYQRRIEDMLKRLTT